MWRIVIVLLIATILLVPMPIIFIMILNKKEKNIKQVTIKEYIEEYLEKYKKNSQLLEFDFKLKLGESHQVMVIDMIVVGIICFIFMIGFQVFIIKSLFIGGFLFGLCVVCGMMYLFLKKEKTIEKMRLKNSMLELYNRHDKVKLYQLDEINLKYNRFEIRTKYRITKGINIYFNNDKYNSCESEANNIEQYIAFIIIVNLLKTNDIEEIHNLNDGDIEKLQQKFMYREV